MAAVLVVLLLIIVLPPTCHRMMAANRSVVVHTIDSVATTDTAPAVLKFVSLNVAHGRGSQGGTWRADLDRDESTDIRQARYTRIAQLLAELQADVVILNEVDFDSSWAGHRNYATWLAAQAGYRHVLEQANYDLWFWGFRMRHGNAVLSRYPVRLAARLDFPDADAWERRLIGKKRGVACRIDLPDGREIDVIPVHLEHRMPAVRLDSATKISEYAATCGRPVIALGDFNASASDRGNRITAISHLLNAGLAASAPGEPTPEASTFPAGAPVRRIDWVLVGNGATILDQTVIGNVVSDHRGITATVSLPDVPQAE